MNVEKEKDLAASEAIKFIENGMTIGLGSGSTAFHMIRKLADKVKKGLSVKGVPSSNKTAELAKEFGIPLISLDEAGTLDLTIDGTDEFNAEMQLIKGGGGALLREKILAHNSKTNIIIADSSKEVRRLGKFKLPIETIPFATKTIIVQLDKIGLKPELRLANGKGYRTDENNYIVDIDIQECNDLPQLNNQLIQIPGVVETGLFLDSTDLIIMGKGDSTVFKKK